jgi:hypothetical protein
MHACVTHDEEDGRTDGRELGMGGIGGTSIGHSHLYSSYSYINSMRDSHPDTLAN